MAKYNYDIATDDKEGANDINGTKVQFLSGLQSELNKYFLNSGDLEKSGKATEGAFYLTTDTHRLYIGREVDDNGTTKTIPVAINEGIQVVDRLQYNESYPSQTYLPTNPQVGEFYYVKNDNILAICNGKNEEGLAKWTQLNPDTNTWIDTKVTGLTISNAYVKDIYTQVESGATFDAQETYYTKTGNIYTEATDLEAFAEETTYYTKTSDDKLTVDVTLAQTSLNNDNTSATSPANIVTSFTIPLDGNGGIFNFIDAGITSSVTNHVASVSLTGPAANNSTVEISGANGTTINSTANGFQISSKTYNLNNVAAENDTAVNSAIINLTDEVGAHSTVTLKAKDNLLIDNHVANEITFYHTGPTAAVADYVLTTDENFQDGKTYFTRSDDTYTAINFTTNETYDDPHGPIPANTIYEQISEFGNNTTTPAEGGTIRVPKISRDANGHIVSIAETNITLPTAGGIAGITANGGNLKLTKNDNSQITSPTRVTYYYVPATGEAQSNVTYYADNTGTALVTQPTEGADVSGYYVAVTGPALGYVMTVDGTTQVYPNQSSLGSFYSATTIDNRINNAVKGLNALTYKGPAGDQLHPLPTENVNVGDVYVVISGATSISYRDVDADDDDEPIAHSVKAGDLLIAQGTEDSQGYITDSTLKWAHIESGDIDTTYTWTRVGDVISIDNNVGDNLGKFTVSGGNKIDVAPSVNNGVDTFTVNHVTSGVIGDNAEYTFSGPTTISGADTVIDNNPNPSALSSGSTFVVPTLKIDKYGHIVAAGTKTLRLPDSVNDTYDLTNKLNDNSPDATIRLLKNDNLSIGEITLAGDSNEGVLVRATPVYTVTTDLVAQAGTTYYTDNTGTTTVPVTVGETSVVGYYVATARTTKGTIDIKHATKVVSRPAATAGTITAEKFTVISGIDTDKFGHVSAINSTEYTLPVYTTDWGSVTTSSGVNSFTGTLCEGSTHRGTVTIASSTLDIVASGTNDARTYTVEVKWGTF